VTFLGQTIVSFSQAVALPMPPFVAAIWFASDQVNTACSIAVNGTMVSIICLHSRIKRTEQIKKLFFLVLR
jgi:hypothetical protein